MQAEKVAKANEEISKSVGFRAVVDALSQSGVVVVGHNCILDFLHTTAKFVGPVPHSPEEWLTVVKQVFPRFYDTKYVLSQQFFRGKVNDSGLSAAYATLTAPALASGRDATPVQLSSGK